MIEPEPLGLKRCNLSELQGGDAEESARIVRRVLQGAKGPGRDVVVLNSGAALYVSGQANSIEQGMGLAADSIDKGKALEKLNELVLMTNAAR
jgi:anthranilate phosphoribosyltransferase